MATAEAWSCTRSGYIFSADTFVTEAQWCKASKSFGRVSLGLFSSRAGRRALNSIGPWRLPLLHGPAPALLTHPRLFLHRELFGAEP